MFLYLILTCCQVLLWPDKFVLYEGEKDKIDKNMAKSDQTTHIVDNCLYLIILYISWVTCKVYNSWLVDLKSNSFSPLIEP